MRAGVRLTCDAFHEIESSCGEIHRRWAGARIHAHHGDSSDRRLVDMLIFVAGIVRLASFGASAIPSTWSRAAISGVILNVASSGQF